MKKIWELPFKEYHNELEKLSSKERYEVMRERLRWYKFDKQTEEVELKLIDLNEKYHGVDYIAAFPSKFMEMISIFKEVYPDFDFSEATRLFAERQGFGVRKEYES